MRIEKNFCKRTAPLVEVQMPHVSHGKGCALGIAVTAFPVDHREEIGVLHMHMTPEEAITFGLRLIEAARDRIKAGGEF